MLCDPNAGDFARTAPQGDGLPLRGERCAAAVEAQAALGLDGLGFVIGDGIVLASPFDFCTRAKINSPSLIV